MIIDSVCACVRVRAIIIGWRLVPCNNWTSELQTQWQQQPAGSVVFAVNVKGTNSSDVYHDCGKTQNKQARRAKQKPSAASYQPPDHNLVFLTLKQENFFQQRIRGEGGEGVLREQILHYYKTYSILQYQKKGNMQRSDMIWFLNMSQKTLANCVMLVHGIMGIRCILYIMVYTLFWIYALKNMWYIG